MHIGKPIFGKLEHGSKLAFVVINKLLLQENAGFRRIGSSELRCFLKGTIGKLIVFNSRFASARQEKQSSIGVIMRLLRTRIIIDGQALDGFFDISQVKDSYLPFVASGETSS